MFEVTKEFSFEAAHSLPHLPEGHKCRNLHGHSYKVLVRCKASVLDQDNHWVVDYAEISEHVEPLLKVLDHANLNMVLSRPSTAENLAMWIYQVLANDGLTFLDSVEVRETEKTSVVYKP